MDEPTFKDDKTLLYRQVHPSWMQNGRVTSQVFKPTPKDDKYLSVYNGDLTTSVLAWGHYTKQLNHPSIGVLAVTVEECTATGLSAKPEPKPFKEHAIIDYNTCASNSVVANKAKQLRAFAIKRDWCH